MSEREEFEKWFKDNHERKGVTVNLQMKEDMWIGWQASRAQGGDAVGVVTFDGTVAWFPSARVHAGMEVYSAPQQDKWIPEGWRNWSQLPTEEDTNYEGKIWVILENTDQKEYLRLLPLEMALLYMYKPNFWVSEPNGSFIKKWHPGLERPSQPEQESE